ncbi:MAG: hypothetical protein ACM3W8_04265 [Sideroxydans sp.]
MLTLPSMWSLIISTIVFFLAVWYVRRYLDEQGIPKGMTRGMLVLTLASLMSWGAGEAVGWAQREISGPPPKTQSPGGLSQLLESPNPQSPVQPQP